MKTLKRTQDEILVRIEEVEGDDFFGFQRSDMIDYLDFNHAKPFLKDGVTSDEWCAKTNPVEAIREYMSFAWDKCNDERGLSASRSIEHMTAWLWLAGDNEAVDVLEEGLFGHYGADALEYICNRYDLPIERE